MFNSNLARAKPDGATTRIDSELSVQNLPSCTRLSEKTGCGNVEGDQCRTHDVDLGFSHGQPSFVACSHAEKRRTKICVAVTNSRMDLLDSSKTANLYHRVTRILRDFFNTRNFRSVYMQNGLSVIASCKDPKCVQTFDCNGDVWPLPQTGQLWLDCELLTRKPENVTTKGYYCESTSYLKDPSPVFEFASTGDMGKLMDLETDLLRYMGYEKPLRISYLEALEMVNKHQETGVLSCEDREVLCEEHGPVVLLYNFPKRTEPHWNVKRDPTNANIYCKVDVLMHGMTTIDSAERSCDPDHMRHAFLSLSDGEFAGFLFNKFGKERTLRDLDEFLGCTFAPYCGAAIDIRRLMRSYELLQNESSGFEYNYNAGCSLS